MKLLVPEHRNEMVWPIPIMNERKERDEREREINYASRRS